MRVRVGVGVRVRARCFTRAGGRRSNKVRGRAKGVKCERGSRVRITGDCQGIQPDETVQIQDREAEQRRDKTRQGKTRQDTARQDKTRHDTIRHDTTRHGTTNKSEIRMRE